MRRRRGEEHVADSGACEPDAAELLEAIAAVIRQSPLRHMITPGGFQMSVAMTNCGTAGWITDRSGYRYDEGSNQKKK